MTRTKLDLEGKTPEQLEQASERFRREHALANEAEPAFPVKTLGLILFVVFGLPIVGLVVLGVLEWRTLADDTPGNHITATLRRAFKAQPGAVMLASLAWIAFLVAIAAGIGGHVFWP